MSGSMVTGRRKRMPVEGYTKNDTRVRYIVYRIHDESGAILYIGRSCNVRSRIAAHYADAVQTYDQERRARKAWMFSARRITVRGPFTWQDAAKVEREEIEAHQPVGNRQFTKAHGYRPLSEGGGQYFQRRPTS